jgi:hypothetical protein
LSCSLWRSCPLAARTSRWPSVRSSQALPKSSPSPVSVLPHSREVRERSINLHALGPPLSRGASSTPKVMCALSGAAERGNPAMFFSHLLCDASSSSGDTFHSRAFRQVYHCHPKLLFCF